EFVEDLLQEAYPQAGIIIDRLDGDIHAYRYAEIDTESAEWEDLVYEVQMGPDSDDLLEEYIALADENGDVEDEEEEGEADYSVEALAPSHQKHYARLITDQDFTFLASLHPERALHKSGELAGGLSSHDARLAFIAHVGYRLFFRALKATWEAENEKTERKVLAAIFLEAHAEAHEKYAAEQEAIMTGQVMTAPVFRALTHGLGLSDEQIAKALRVNARTVRHWRAGTAPIPAGVTTEMWGLWEHLLGQAYAAIGDTAPDQPAILDTDTPLPLILAVATLHGRVVVKPEPPRYY
ncbi:helix-turn-helix domain-containing protein, partial [Trueperella pyogenes]